MIFGFLFNDIHRLNSEMVIMMLTKLAGRHLLLIIKDILLLIIKYTLLLLLLTRKSV